LASLSRLHGDKALPDGVEAYIALEERATALAVLRDGAVIAAREFQWGFLEETGTAPSLRPRDEIAMRLIDEIGRLVSGIGAAPDSLRQVVICGGLPELRSMTALMTERLDVEIEPLDSLF